LCEGAELADMYSAFRKEFSSTTTNAKFGADSHEVIHAKTYVCS